MPDGRTGESAADVLRPELQELYGLSPYEAQVLVGLLQVGLANTLELSQVSEVPRTNIYRVLESLGAKGLAERLPQEGPAVWTCRGGDEVLDCLEAAHADAEADRLRLHHARRTRVRELVARSLPRAPPRMLPCVRQIIGAPQVRRAYDQLLSEAEEELVMFSRPPYSWVAGNVNEVILAMLARGVATRVIYQAAEWEDPAAEAFRSEMSIYHQAGVEGRVVERLPMKLVVVDRRATLVAMDVEPDVAYPTNLLIENRGFAETQAMAFETLWSSARVVPDEASGSGASPDGSVAAQGVGS